MSSRLTINDIAQLSGVGKSTVSRVLNNEGRVSQVTRDRVQAVIDKYRFVPSKSARAMRGLRPQVIGIIVSRLDSNAENQALRTILPQLYQQGCDPIIIESQFDNQLVAENLRMLAQRAVDGIILFAFSGLKESLLKPWQHKMVVIARHLPTYTCVTYDDQAAIHQLMNHLYYQGHRRIGYIGVTATDATTGQQRWQAYQHFCQQHQLPELSVLGELSYQSGYSLTQQIIQQSVTAIICASDTIALGSCKLLQEQNNSTIQICGLGNNQLLRFLFPQVISVELGYQTSGHYAVSQLFKLLQGSEHTTHLTVPYQLITP